MGKWETIFTNKIGASSVNSKAFNCINNVKSLTAKELKEEGDKAFEARTAAEDKLIQAFKDKKLKNKASIKRAKNLIAKRKKTEETQVQEKEVVS